MKTLLPQYIITWYFENKYKIAILNIGQIIIFYKQKFRSEKLVALHCYCTKQKKIIQRKLFPSDSQSEGTVYQVA